VLDGIIITAVLVLATIARIISGQRVTPMAKRRGGSVRRLRVTNKSRPGPGRPPVHSETWSKVSVVLFDRQIAMLDRLATATHGKNGKVFNRTEIIRALIDGLIDSGMDITGTSSEADLRARVARRLGTPFR
jgi:hypothetical protein